ncbi:hypothetical protein LIER_00085 [Lithospermum erythrorhizon]|uniref:Uncharacterized protein n=1 Tax=Lithospermum erythrorhizon TaxID=34254 RepID=A0AAV3NGP0_LITER
MGVFDIINSSNGLFLCRFCVKYQFRHCVINPGSRRVFILPQEPGNPRGGNYVFALDFQPLESPFYKIVCFRDTYIYNEKMMKKPGSLEILIYSSENGTWKTSRKFPGNQI